MSGSFSQTISVKTTDAPENLYGTGGGHESLRVHEFAARLRYTNRSRGVPHDGRFPYASLDVDANPGGVFRRPNR